jgi:hypothetical protein
MNNQLHPVFAGILNDASKRAKQRRDHEDMQMIIDGKDDAIASLEDAVSAVESMSHGLTDTQLREDALAIKYSIRDVMEAVETLMQRVKDY